MEEQVRLARELLSSVRHIALATVNEDGSPHNSPLMKIINDDMTKLYIGSYENSLHSENLLRTGQAFVVIYDSTTPAKTGAGLYLTCTNARVCEDDELTEALKAHNAVRARYDKDPIDIEYYRQDAPSQRMFSMDIAKIELYSAYRDASGLVKYEERREIKAKELLS